MWWGTSLTKWPQCYLTLFRWVSLVVTCTVNGRKLEPHKVMRSNHLSCFCLLVFFGDSDAVNLYWPTSVAYYISHGLASLLQATEVLINPQQGLFLSQLAQLANAILWVKDISWPGKDGCPQPHYIWCPVFFTEEFFFFFFLQPIIISVWETERYTHSHT